MWVNELQQCLPAALSGGTDTVMNAAVSALVVGVGGAAGSVARYGVQKLAERRFGATFPVGTMIVNVTGCFLIGVVATVVARRMIPAPEAVRLAVAVGFLGGFTTFSSYGLETAGLVSRGAWALALGNAIGSVIAGLLAVALGIALARRFG